MGGLSVVGFPFQIVSQPLQADFFFAQMLIYGGFERM
jgi:hypothetical protein